MLREYKRKRNFNITPEPSGEEKPGSKSKPSSSFKKKSAPASRKLKITTAEGDAVIQQLSEARGDKVTLELDKVILPITSLNKVYWPATAERAAVTKRDYLIYLTQTSMFMLPHLKDRLLTLRRFPNGIANARFYQKHWEQRLPAFVQTAKAFTENEQKDQDFLACNNLATLLWLGQIADLEIHTSHTRITSWPDARKLSTDMTGSLENLLTSIGNYPDFMVLDLDPYLYSGKEGKGAEPELHRLGFDKCREIIKYLKGKLDALGLKSFIKTSGKTGLHIYLPIKRNVDYDTVRAMSQIICKQILKERPDEVTMEWSVKHRTGKIFLDHNMNARSKSLVAPYSARISAEASVSTPIEWSELDDIYPTDFNMLTIPKRLEQVGDPWADLMKEKNDLTSIFSGNLRRHS